jgi:hypothetical protein
MFQHNLIQCVVNSTIQRILANCYLVLARYVVHTETVTLHFVAVAM